MRRIVALIGTLAAVIVFAAACFLGEMEWDTKAVMEAFKEGSRC
jgi:hypothetical protein